MIKLKDYGFKGSDMEEKSRGQPPLPILRYPKPKRRLHLVYQSFNQSIEEVYFFLLQNLREDWGLPEIDKITDIFTASEQSAFWGASQQRLQIQQSQVQNYLATIGKLIKDLFQMVREVRVVKERLALYEATNKTMKGSVASRRRSIPEEIVLRGYWVDMKDGGVKSPGSVYGLASTLGYVTLPDLFFSAPVMKRDEVSEYVDKGLKEFNAKVRDTLKKKLAAYLYWKEFTQRELEQRLNFTLKYLRQHYNSIQLYISWVKPYLRNVKRLQMNFEKSSSEDLIGAFEGSFTEVEIMCHRKIPGNPLRPVVILTLEFRTQPHMDFHQDGYQHKGPVHVGRSEFWMRGYLWTDEQMKKYKDMREDETFDMLGDISKDLRDAIDALGDDVRGWLKEEGQKFPEDEKKEAKSKALAEKKKKELMSAGVLEPFKAVFSGFKDIFTAFSGEREKKEGSAQPDAYKMKKFVGAASFDLDLRMYNSYKVFKKGHRMITW